jgi:glycine/D-amino acid oxidase-like deaminating enzyme
VGSGILGAWTLVEASRRAHPLSGPAMLLDGAQSGAHVPAPSGLASEAFVHANLAGLARHGIEVAANFETSVGRKIHFGRPGALVLGLDEPGRVVEQLAERRIEGASVLDAAGAQRVFRGIELGQGEDALWLASAAHLDPRTYHSQLLDLARTLGAITRFRAGVQSLRIEGDRVTGLETAKGTIETERVIVTSMQALEQLMATPVLASNGACSAFLTELQETTSTTSTASQSFTSPLVADDAGLDPSQPGLVADIFADPSKLESYFTPSEAPTYSHPALVDLAAGTQVACAPAAGQLHFTGVGAMEPELSGGALPEEPLGWLMRRLPFHGDSPKPEAGPTKIQSRTRTSGLPIAGKVPGIEGLFLAIASQERAIELAPSLGEGVVQLAFNEPLVAFDGPGLGPLS